MWLKHLERRWRPVVTACSQLAAAACSQRLAAAACSQRLAVAARSQRLAVAAHCQRGHRKRGTRHHGQKQPGKRGTRHNVQIQPAHTCQCGHTSQLGHTRHGWGVLPGQTVRFSGAITRSSKASEVKQEDVKPPLMPAPVVQGGSPQVLQWCGIWRRV